MNREEAIKWLNQIEDKYIHGGDDDFDAKRKRAIAMAIEALEESPRPIDPTITVDLESGVVPLSACESKGPKTIVYVDRPKGKWINRKEEVDGFLFIGRRCSNCDWWENDGYNLPFCPNCGADMRGENK